LNRRHSDRTAPDFGAEGVSDLSDSRSEPSVAKTKSRNQPSVVRGLDKLQEAQVSRTRTKVLVASAQILAAGGVDALTVEAVIAETGVARSTIYRQFGTIHQLLVAAFRELLGPPLTASSEGELRTRFVKALSQLSTELSNEPGRTGVPTLLGAAAHDQAMAEVLDEFTAERRGPLEAMIRYAIASGELNSDTNVELVACLLIGPILYSVLIRREPLDNTLLEAIVDSALRSAT
jgi:TetR/AcrR family transcriptional regulator, regulator of autoinduction and epiphytic fitness